MQDRIVWDGGIAVNDRPFRSWKLCQKASDDLSQLVKAIDKVLHHAEAILTNGFLDDGGQLYYVYIAFKR